MMSETHRTRVSNVLVVGSGAAGLRAAIAVHAAGRDVVIVGKRLRKDAHTVLAAGSTILPTLSSRATILAIPSLSRL